MNTEPLVSGDCAALLMLAAILAVALCAALVGLCIHIRNAVLGARLTKACGGSWRTAVVEIENIRAQNDVVELAVTGHLSEDTQ
jgi:hypothetical protein